jgi:hypothetical protein
LEVDPGMSTPSYSSWNDFTTLAAHSQANAIQWSYDGEETLHAWHIRGFTTWILPPRGMLQERVKGFISHLFLQKEMFNNWSLNWTYSCMYVTWVYILHPWIFSAKAQGEDVCSHIIHNQSTC